MPVRTISRAITFHRSFLLSGLDAVQPAGTYVLETDEEQIDGVSFLTYRRTAIRIHLPVRPGVTETLDVDAAELELALAEDAMDER